MDISINGYRVTVSDDSVNRYKNDTANCPFCWGNDINKCPVGHPYIKSEPPPSLDPNIWVERSEDDLFSAVVGVYRLGADGKGYRRRDNQRVAEFKLELKKLGIKESDVTEIKRRG